VAPGIALDRADRANKILVSSTEFLDRDDAFRCTRKGVAPKHHRDSAGVPSRAEQDDRKSCRAGDCSHNPNRHVFGL
jgi:hypothetical protein